MAKMPLVVDAIKNANLSEENKILADMIVGRGGRLRSAKPENGDAAFIWRNVAFYISPNSQHHCMPCTDDFGLIGVWEKKPGESAAHSMNRVRARRAELQVVVDAIVNQVPKEQWHGVRRWHSVFNG